MAAYKRRLVIIFVILIALIAGYFLGGKNLIYPPRASESLTLYNIDSRWGDGLDFTHMPTRTVRWPSLPVAIYNKAEIKNLQEIIDEWNQAVGREVFRIGSPDSPIIIEGSPDISPAGILNYSFRNYLLTNAQITVNPSWLNNPELADPEMIRNPNNVLKRLLGRALGFFGSTTDDPNSIMDLDWPVKEETIINPFVVSVIKELYNLPAGTRPASPLDKNLRWAVKKYNIDTRPVDYQWATLKEVEEYKKYGTPPSIEMPVLTMRWRSLPVAVYDKDNLTPDLQNIINEWNQAMGQEVFKIGGLDSPITIEADFRQGPYEQVFAIAKKSGRLDKVRIVGNPNWLTSNKIKHQLGHALGFIGHTTDDPGGIMDIEYEKQKNISPFVVSVLKELYKLPVAVRIVDQFGRSDQEVLDLRQVVKKYNIDLRVGDREELADIVRTVRWRNFPVSIYNQANISNLQFILDEWNQAMGQEVFKSGGSDSPIVIEADTNSSPFPEFYTETKNYLITIFKIKANPQNPNLHYLKHQLGHALGFFGHTKDDDLNGIMNEDHRRTDTVISPFVVSFLKELYRLPPSVLIKY